jgi:phage terminase large subunit-like protein
MTKTYRSASSYVGSTEEARQAQLENLLRGRAKRARKALVKPPSLKDPAYETDIIRFAEEQFYIPETRKPIVLEPFQKKDILKPIFYAEDRPTMALVGQTKKSGKSTLAATVAAWVLFCGEDFSETYIAARDKDQANWIIFSKLVKAIEMNPNMLLNVNITKDAVERPATGSVVRCLPTEVSAAGLNPNLVIFDELWSYDLESMTKFFEELTTVPTRKHPLILIVSYAGYDTDEDNLLYSLYQKGLKGRDPTFFFYWDHKNRMPWQTKQYLKQQRGRLRPGTYRRLHLNEWTSGEEAFIDMDLWDACVDRKHRPALPNKEVELIIGVDIGISHDTCAVVGVMKDKDKIKLACHRKWQPTKKNPIDLEETVEAYVKELDKGYTVSEVRYDPYQFHRSAMTLQKAGVNMVEFPQTTDRLTAMSQNLYDLVKGGNLVLYRDNEMKQHAQKATAKETPRGWRIVKKKASHKIDLIIALAMAALGATKIDSVKPDIFILDPHGHVDHGQETKEERIKRIREDDRYWRG